MDVSHHLVGSVAPCAQGSGQGRKGDHHPGCDEGVCNRTGENAAPGKRNDREAGHTCYLTSSSCHFLVCDLDTITAPSWSWEDYVRSCLQGSQHSTWHVLKMLTA